MGYLADYCCINIMGRVRKNNEDNFYVQGRFRREDELKNDIACLGTIYPGEGEIAAVYDGMGGEACGEVASLLASRGTRRLVGREDDAEKAISDLCLELNHAVCRYAQENFVGVMGATAAMALFCENDVVVCNLGDSRIYLLRGNEMRQLSVDHTAQVSGKRKAPLTQYLGLPEDEYMLEPSTCRVPYQDGDRLLISSDGLTDMVDELEIAKTLAAGKDVKETCRKLVSQALQGGGVDNITVIVLQIEKEKPRLI